MKKYAIILLVLLLLVGAYGCAAQNEPEESAPVTETQEPADNNSENSENTGTEVNETASVTESVSTEPYTEVIQIEGMDETVNYKLTVGRYGYLMPMDIDRFEFDEGEEADYFRSTANDKVFMTVTYINDTTADKEAQTRMDVPEEAEAVKENVSIGEYEAVKVHVKYGSEPDSRIVDFYLVEHDGGVYEISHEYFLQAAEGFGARMHYMTQGFEITK